MASLSETAAALTDSVRSLEGQLDDLRGAYARLARSHGGWSSAAFKLQAENNALRAQHEKLARLYTECDLLLREGADIPSSAKGETAAEFPHFKDVIGAVISRLKHAARERSADVVALELKLEDMEASRDKHAKEALDCWDALHAGLVENGIDANRGVQRLGDVVTVALFELKRAREEAAAWKKSYEGANRDAGELATEMAKLRGLINSAAACTDFFRDVQLEAAHQVERWGVEHDAGKRPEDWMTLMLYLLGKAARAHFDGDREKLLHHIVTGAAVCFNWWRRMTGAEITMRPGVAPRKLRVDGCPSTECSIRGTCTGANGCPYEAEPLKTPIDRFSSVDGAEWDVFRRDDGSLYVLGAPNGGVCWEPGEELHARLLKHYAQLDGKGYGTWVCQHEMCGLLVLGPCEKPPACSRCGRAAFTWRKANKVGDFSGWGRNWIVYELTDGSLIMRGVDGERPDDNMQRNMVNAWKHLRSTANQARVQANARDATNRAGAHGWHKGAEEIGRFDFDGRPWRVWSYQDDEHGTFFVSEVPVPEHLPGVVGRGSGELWERMLAVWRQLVRDAGHQGAPRRIG